MNINETIEENLDAMTIDRSYGLTRGVLERPIEFTPPPNMHSGMWSS